MLEETEWDRWRREQEEKARGRLKEQQQIERNLSTKKTPITEHEREMILALSGCTFLPGSFDKRFVRSLYHYETYPTRDGKIETVDEISEKQRYWLNQLAHKYRRQIGRDLSKTEGGE